MLLNQFAMSEQGGFLRVGVTHQGVRVFIDDVVFDDPAVDPAPIEPGSGGSEEPVVQPEPEVAENLNEIVVLDTDGDLDVVGRTERFGHPGETLHGIRFDGEIAYAVTFLQTDPFYVIDVADPAAPGWSAKSSSRASAPTCTRSVRGWWPASDPERTAGRRSSSSTSATRRSRRWSTTRPSATTRR